MAYEIPGYRMSGTAEGNLTGKIGCAVTCSATEGFVLAAAAVPIDGVLDMEGTAGQMVTAVTSGIVNAVFGAAVTKGDSLTTNAAGQFITAVNPNAIVGKALEAGALDEVHPVLLGYKGVVPL